MDHPTSVVFLAAMFAGIGLLFAGLAVPLIRRRIAPNWLYGLRVRATLTNKSVWYAANERIGRSMLALGIVMLVMALGFLIVPSDASLAYFAITIGVLTLGATLGSLDAWRFANRLAREREPEGGETGNID